MPNGNPPGSLIGNPPTVIGSLILSKDVYHIEIPPSGPSEGKKCPEKKKKGKIGAIPDVCNYQPIKHDYGWHTIKVEPKFFMVGMKDIPGTSLPQCHMIMEKLAKQMSEITGETVTYTYDAASATSGRFSCTQMHLSKIGDQFDIPPQPVNTMNEIMDEADKKFKQPTLVEMFKP